jgi:hypothetical protein
MVLFGSGHQGQVKPATTCKSRRGTLGGLTKRATKVPTKRAPRRPVRWSLSTALRAAINFSASSHQPIQKLIRPHHLNLVQRMAVRQMAQHQHRLGLGLFAGKAQQCAVGFGV